MPRREVELLGCKWLTVVDFGEPDRSLDKRLAFATMLSWFAIIFDVLNLILDAIFIRKLFNLRADNLNEDIEDSTVFEDFSPKIIVEEFSPEFMLCVTVSSSATALIFGPLLLKIIERKDPLRFDLARVEMVNELRNSYYSYWAFVEMSAFLLENAGTIYIYYLGNNTFDRSNFFDIANVATSVSSGILSSIIMCWTLLGFANAGDSSCSTFFFWLNCLGFGTVVLAGYIAYYALFCLLGSDCDEGTCLIVFNTSFVVGALIQCTVITGVPFFLVFSKCCVYRQTSMGLMPEGRLPLANGNGNGNNY